MNFKKLLVFAAFVFSFTVSYSQLSLTNGTPSATIDFSNSMQTGVGTNTSTAFSAAGFSANPSNTNSGRLNSNAWALTGWSDGNLAFGGTQTTASTDYTRGPSPVSVATGGIYAFTGSPQSAANPCIMFQPGGSDFAPGTITLKIINNGTTNITQLVVSYNLYVRNDQGRSTSFNFSHSADNSTYTSVAALDYTTPTTLDAAGWVLVGTSPSRSTTITGLSIAAGAVYYLRWSTADVGGTGSRDEIGLDDISVAATFATPASTASKIVNDGSFTAPSNISYSSYQETNLTSASLDVAQFILQDGGGSSDADALATTLTDITFSLTGNAVLRQVAIYDGTTEVAEATVSGSTVSFTGISMAAADNSNKTFKLKASFQSTVTDNTQFSFSVTQASATASSSGSGFTTFTATTPTTTDLNRIEVTATALTFTTQPTPTTIATNTSFTTQPIVKAVDVNNNIDLDYTNSVTVTTPSATFAGQPTAFVAGVLTFTSGFQYSAGGDGTLTIDDGNAGTTNATSTTITVSAYTISTGTVSTSPFCVGAANTSASGSVAYTTTGVYSGATFQAELSTSGGGFPGTVIGSATVSGTNPSGSVSFTIPAGTAAAATYKVRVNCVSPAVTGSSSSNFTVNNPVAVTTGSPFSAIGLNGMTLTWTNPANGCYDDIIVIASTGTITGTPVNGSFTANAAYGTPAAAQLGGYAVYQGTGTSVAVTALTQSTTYNFMIYTRKGTDYVAIGSVLSQATLNPTITTGAVATSPFCVSATSTSATGTVAYTTTGTFSGTFTAKLIASNGTTVVNANIGTGTSPISITIPAGTAAGSYFVRVDNNTPAITGSNSASITVNNPVAVTTGTPFSAIGLNGMTLTWTNPANGCYDDIIVIASTGTITGTPVNGSFTANAAYGTPAAAQLGGFAVYQGTGTSVAVTGLASATTYNFIIYTRKGSDYVAIGSLLSQATLSPPSVVINKFQNSGTTDPFELLVISNNLDMRGMIVKDFSSNGDNDGGGKITFNSIAFWQSIPSGTLIQIVSGTGASDIDATDFTLNIGRDNTTYFTTLTGFDIGNTDMLMIKSAGSGTSGLTGNIHSFMAGTGGAQYNSLTSGFKMIGPGLSVNPYAYAVNSTSTISDYNGSDASNASSGLTFLQPNNTTNSIYICSLRSGGNTQPTSTVANANITFSSITTGGMTINWTNPVSGGGNNRIVVARLSTTTAVPPTDGIDYNTSTVFSSPNGTNGTTGTGNVVVFDGSGTSVTITGLAAGTDYAFDIYEYNGVGFCANYLTTAGTNNQLTLGNTIVANSLTGVPVCLNGSAGTGTINYTPNGTYTGTFTAKLIASNGTTVVNANIGTGASPITFSIPSNTPPGTYYIRVDNDNPAITGTLSASFTVNQKPTLASGGVTTSSVCVGSSATISLSGLVVSSTSTVSYTVNGGSTQTVSVTADGSGAGSFTIVSPVNGQIVAVTRIACSTDATCYTDFSTNNSVALIVNPLPVAAGSITGTATVCQGSNNVSYSVGAINNATSYTWAYSGTGATISGNTQNITINFAANATGGNLTVRGTNSCGNGTISANYAITVNPLPSAAGTITGSAAVCAGQTGVTYSVPTITNATSYTWAYSGTGATISGTTSSITIDFAANATAGNLTVRGTNTCGNGTVSANYAITINAVPTGVSATSNSPVCAGSTIQLTALPNGASSYVWTGPNGFTNGSSSTTTYTQNFNTLAISGVNTWTNNSTITDWYSSNTGTSTTSYTGSDGSANGGARYAYGTVGSTERALGSIGSSNSAAGSYAHGYLYRNLTGNPITNITVSYTLEEWRDGGPSAGNQSVIVSYKTSSSPITTLTPIATNDPPTAQTGWTGVAGLTLTSPTASGVAGAIDGNNAANRVSVSNVSLGSLTLAPNDYIMIKWEDPDHTPTDHGLAIDDVSITFTSSSLTQNPTRANADATMAGTYNLVVTNAAGCSTSASTVVQVGATEPTAVATGLSVTAAGLTTMSIGWTNPVSNGGNKRIVVARLTSIPAVAPTDLTLYTASTNFSSPSSTTGAGNVVVYNGTGTSVSVTGLANASNYTFDIYEYNDISNACPNYYATPASIAFSTGPTSVQFTIASATVSEGVGTYNLIVSITNPSPTAATTGSVNFVSGSSTGSAADINGFSTSSFTFPAGSSANQTITITVTDDALVEATAETLVFDLVNVTGGISVAEGTPNQFTLSITDNEPIGTIIYSTATGSATSDPIWSYNAGGPGQTISSLVSGGFDGTAGKDFVIQSGHTVTFPNGTLYNMNNLTVQSTAKAWRSTFNSGTYSYINLFGNATINGALGNNTTAGDGLGLNFAGTSCTLSGTGVVNMSRFKKPSAADLPLSNPTATATTAAIINMNVNLWHDGTCIHNEAANSTNLNLTINAGKTLTVQSTLGDVAIDGSNGQGSGNSCGTYTINGTLTINGKLIASNNNGAGTTAITVGSTGIINAYNTDLNLALGNGTAFTFSTGGLLNVYNALNLISGTITSASNIVIKSNVTSTGFINDFTSGYSGSISGNVKVERYITSGPNGFRYIGAPVNNGGGVMNLSSITGFVISGSPGQIVPLTGCPANPSNVAPGSPYGTFMRWEEAGPYGSPACRLRGWWFQTTGSMALGRGYGAKLSGGNTVIYTGAPNTGASPAYTCTNTNVFSTALNGWNLVSNPFPSSITIDNTDGSTNNNMPAGFDGQIQFYQTSGPYTGTYLAINVGTAPANIALGQGFWVRVSNVGSASWSLNNAYRVTTGATYYAENSPVQHHLQVNVSGNGYMDKTDVNFLSGADNGLDFYDANKWDSRAEQPTLYTKIGYDQAAINSLPVLTEATSIPLGLKPGTNGNYTFTFDDLATFPASAMLYLEDLKVGLVTNLRSTNTYAFTADVSDNTDRFVIHFKPGVQVEVANQDCDNAGSIEVVQPAPTVWAAYNLKDNNGVVYAQGSNLNGSVTINNLQPQEYILTLTHPTGYVAQEYITVNGVDAVSATLNASATNVQVDQAIDFTATATNATAFSWNFGDGMTTAGNNIAQHSYNAAGTYNVTLTASNDVCSDVVSKTIIVGNTTTGINNKDADALKIYGVGNHLIIEFIGTNNDNANLAMYNMIGQKVESITGLSIINGHSEILLKDIKPGYYIVQVTTGSRVYNKKVYLTAN